MYLLAQYPQYFARGLAFVFTFSNDLLSTVYFNTGARRDVLRGYGSGFLFIMVAN